MSKALTVAEKLEVEVLRRGANGAIPQIFLLLSMIFFIPDFNHVRAYRIVCFILIAILAGRFLIFKKLQNDPVKLASTNPLNLYLGVSTSFGWAIINGIAVLYFHVNSCRDYARFHYQRSSCCRHVFTYSCTKTSKSLCFCAGNKSFCSDIFF
jgi:hypothetical protein